MLGAEQSTMSSSEAGASAMHVPAGHEGLGDWPGPGGGSCGGDEGDALFSWQDYSVLATVLLVSCAVGIFYGVREWMRSRRQQAEADAGASAGEKGAAGAEAGAGDAGQAAADFLLGGSSMPPLPMAISLAASFVTAVELLGNTSEMYLHGTQFWMSCLAFLIVVPLTSQLYLPVYRAVEVTSAYEYLEMRFGRGVRSLAAAMYVVQMTLYTSVAVYAPALALSAVTGLNVYLAVTCVYAVCIIYSSQGGMRAVIITDTFQAAVLMGSIFVVLALGNDRVGGLSVVWQRSSITERLEFFNLNPDPTVRHSFWSVVVGGSFYWATMFCSNQASVQKYMSVATIKQARTALWVSCAALAIIFTANFYTGMVIYADYHGCDPIKTEAISASDQLLPYYVMQHMAHLKGVAGFFVAGIFSASLGTVAAALNSLAAVTVSDFMLGAFPAISIAPEKAGTAAKWASAIFGAISFALVFVVERLGGVLQVALSFNGMVGGVTLGMFSLGMFFPWANNKGALLGALTASALVAWIGVGAQVSGANQASDATKFTSADLCPACNLTGDAALNFTTASSITTAASTMSPAAPEEPVFVLYRLSYLWYSAIGCVTTVVVGLVVSLVTGPRDPTTVDPALLSPPVRVLLDNLPKSLRNRLSLRDMSKRRFSTVRPPCVSSIYRGGIINAGISLDDEKPVAPPSATVTSSQAPPPASMGGGSQNGMPQQMQPDGSPQKKVSSSNDNNGMYFAKL
ncbi:sodium-coupled monocarboxylate transporter 1-like [Schistocerca gregaria]|uniref:sodium-coupled monocarboxylate transporter 1-like n=1 Tax=Schistocerca gregaria TaxID=7010 RepID=UPI00211E6E1C|nr:sodium-coupled monocarboxylate transporter 1-like [Schistocerca gregaria]